MNNLRIAVVGALGAVGTEMIKTLERRQFPVSTLIPIDVPSLAGNEVKFRGKNVAVRAAGKVHLLMWILLFSQREPRQVLN